MSSVLKNLETEDLTNRWSTIIDEYLNRLKLLKSDLVKINKLRNELLLIREELLSRNIEVDQPPEDEEDCQEEPLKI